MYKFKGGGYLNPGDNALTGKEERRRKGHETADGGSEKNSAFATMSSPPAHDVDGGWFRAREGCRKEPRVFRDDRNKSRFPRTNPSAEALNQPIFGWLCMYFFVICYQSKFLTR